MKKICLVLTVLITLVFVFSVVMALVSRELPVGDRIALVKIEGPIINSTEILEEIKDYRNDPSVKAIVIRVDSPGGAVAPSQEIYEEIMKTRQIKPVVVSMGAVAASGGYYISTAATKVFASPGTITGSIGVIMEIPNLKGLLDKLGIKTEVIKSGKHKDLASVFRGIGKEERKILQNVLQDVHEQFIRDVAEARGLEYEKVKALADGRIFTGRQAKELGLIDSLGNLQDAISEAARLAGIKGQPRIVQRKERLSILELLLGNVQTRYIDEGFQYFRIK